MDGNKSYEECPHVTLKGQYFVLGEALEILLKVVKFNHSIKDLEFNQNS